MRGALRNCKFRWLDRGSILTSAMGSSLLKQTRKTLKSMGSDVGESGSMISTAILSFSKASGRVIDWTKPPERGYDNVGSERRIVRD